MTRLQNKSTKCKNSNDVTLLLYKDRSRKNSQIESLIYTKYKFVTWFSDLFDASLNCVFKVGR